MGAGWTDPLVSLLDHNYPSSSTLPDSRCPSLAGGLEKVKESTAHVPSL